MSFSAYSQEKWTSIDELPIMGGKNWTVVPTYSRTVVLDGMFIIKVYI